jgi:hypothetical protein
MIYELSLRNLSLEDENPRIPVGESLADCRYGVSCASGHAAQAESKEHSEADMHPNGGGGRGCRSLSSDQPASAGSHRRKKCKISEKEVAACLGVGGLDTLRH